MIWAARVAYPTAEAMQMLQNLRNSNESGAPTHPQTPFQFLRGRPSPQANPQRCVENLRKTTENYTKSPKLFERKRHVRKSAPKNESLWGLMKIYCTSTKIYGNLWQILGNHGTQTGINDNGCIFMVNLRASLKSNELHSNILEFYSKSTNICGNS